MQSSDIPVKFPIPFANNADPSLIESIPVDSQIGVTPGRASLHDGFVPLNFQPVGAGGVPPLGKDFNGLLNQDTAWARWQNAGGSVPFDADFAGAIGGYPKGAILQSAVPGNFWVNGAENNAIDPNVGGHGVAGWTALILTGARSGVVISNDGVAPNTKRNIAATSLIVQDSLGNVARLAGVSVSINSAVSGAGGLDTGSIAANLVYYEYVIAQPGGANPTGLMSLSATAPTMPSGYTMKVRVGGGAITDGSSNFYRIKQIGDVAQYLVTATTNTAAMPLLASGSQGTFKLTGMGTGDWAQVHVTDGTTPKAPATASAIRISMTNTYNSGAIGRGMVAPNNNYNGIDTNNPPPLYNGNQGPQSSAVMGELMLESGSIYCASDVSGPGSFGLSLLGWRDAF